MEVRPERARFSGLGVGERRFASVAREAGALTEGTNGPVGVRVEIDADDSGNAFAAGFAFQPLVRMVGGNRGLGAEAGAGAVRAGGRGGSESLGVHVRVISIALHH